MSLGQFRAVLAVKINILCARLICISFRIPPSLYARFASKVHKN